MSGPEQLCGRGGWKGDRPGVKRWLKKVLAKLRRREGKQLLDDAPKKPHYKGWSL